MFKNLYFIVLKGALGRITGLDPALILFSFHDPTSRLADTDASYVDVIHTCGGWMGFEKPIGHADFYPNGGSPSQPGCGIDVTCKCCSSWMYCKKTAQNFSPIIL